MPEGRGGLHPPGTGSVEEPFRFPPVSSLAEFGGKKLDMMKDNPRCCIGVVICDRVMRSDWPRSLGCGTGAHRSGSVVIPDDPEEKRHGLTCSMQHDGGGIFSFSEEALNSVTGIRITPDPVTGKKHG